MRKIFWLGLFFAGYVWMVSTGNEDFVLEKVRALYRLVATWFADADVDFQVRPKKILHKKKERSRRWD